MGCGMWFCSQLDTRTEQVSLGDGGEDGCQSPGHQDAGFGLRLGRLTDTLGHHQLREETTLPQHTRNRAKPDLLLLREKGDGRESGPSLNAATVAGCRAAFRIRLITQFAVNLTNSQSLPLHPHAYFPPVQLGKWAAEGQPLCVRSG